MIQLIQRILCVLGVHEWGMKVPREDDIGRKGRDSKVEQALKQREVANVRVKVPADLSSTGRAKWREFGIDRTIAPIVKALQAGGIDMRGSCCGHGYEVGEIDLQDGRILVVVPNELSALWLEFRSNDTPTLLSLIERAIRQIRDKKIAQRAVMAISLTRADREFIKSLSPRAVEGFGRLGPDGVFAAMKTRKTSVEGGE